MGASMKIIKIVYHDGERIRTYIIKENEYEYKPVPAGYTINVNNESVFIPISRIIRIVSRNDRKR